ncbi:hypothetical protein E3J49_04825, partial [Candidatus Bathyarchaeota archaeon]
QFDLFRDGVFHGFLGWFIEHLADHIVLDTSPKNPRTHWYQTFFPAQQPIVMKKGDVIRAKFSAKVDKKSIKWVWTIFVNNCEMTHNTENSYP